MKRRIKMRGGDEHDAFRSPQYHKWRPGQRKRIKRRYNKRLRLALNKETRT